MEISSLLWVTGGFALFTGIVIGVVLYHFLGSSRGNGGHLKSKVNALEAELEDYKERVSDHFSTTAHLVNRMTDSYRDVHEHLASSANELCNDELTRHRLNDALLGSSAFSAGKRNKKIDQTHQEQPKDYAPRGAVENTGTLSEEFSADNSGKPQ